MRPYLLEIVEHRDDGATVVMPAAHNLEEVARGARVNGGKRLVQHDHPCILQQEPGKEHALKLTGRERANGPSFEPLQPDRRQRLAAFSARLGVAPPKPPISRHAPSMTVSATLSGKRRSMSAAWGR